MPIHLDDKKQAKQLLAGDPRAYDRFFDENFARLYRFAMARLSSDPEGAKEVVQTTLSRAVRSLHTYRAESALFTWLCAICRNEISDWLKKQGRYREHVVLVEDLPEIQAAVDSFRAPAADSPEWQCQRADALRLIEVALDKLPARYGNVLEWKYVQGHSVKEISARLEISLEATQSLIARAKRAFADVYSTLASSTHGEDGWVKP